MVGELLQHFTDEDIGAVVAYLRHIGTDGPAPDAPPTQSDEVTETERLLASADPKMDLGARLYLDNCNACHFVNGRGADEVFPELDGNTLVTAKGATGLMTVILQGAELPSTETRPMRLRMPGLQIVCRTTRLRRSLVSFAARGAMTQVPSSRARWPICVRS